MGSHDDMFFGFDILRSSPRWGYAVCFLIYFREVRQVFESHIETSFRHFFFPDSIKSRAASRRRLIIHFCGVRSLTLGKVPFESGQAAPRVACDFVHGEVEHVVFVQVIEDVYLPRFHEVEQGRIKVSGRCGAIRIPPRSFSVSACLRRVSLRLRNKE